MNNTQYSNQFDKVKLIKQLEILPGKIGFYYKNLVTNDELGYNEDELFTAASVIKLPIYASIAKLAAEGKVSLDEKIQAKFCDRVPPCGALYFFTDEPFVSIRTLCGLMITISDNTATNMLINRFGIDNLNHEFREIGIKNSIIKRLLFDSEASKKGLQNLISPKEMCTLLEKIYKHEFVNPETSAMIEQTLLDQQINHKIPGYLNDTLKVAHKTGEDDGTTHDVGIVYAKQPFVIGFTSNDTDVAEYEKVIRQVSLDLSELNNL